MFNKLAGGLFGGREMSVSIISFFRDNMPNPSFWVFHVSFISRDYMNVCMKY